MEYYIVFKVYFYGEQGWECWANIVTSDLEKAVNKANEILVNMRNSDKYKYDRNRYGVAIQPVIDGEIIKLPQYNNDKYTYEANGDKLFSVGDFY